MTEQETFKKIIDYIKNNKPKIPTLENGESSFLYDFFSFFAHKAKTMTGAVCVSFDNVIGFKLNRKFYFIVVNGQDQIDLYDCSMRKTDEITKFESSIYIEDVIGYLEIRSGYVFMF